MLKKLTILMLAFPFFVSAQVPDIDSLINKVPDTLGKEKVLLLSDISYFSSFNNTELALEYGQKCLSAAKELGDSLLIAEGFNTLAIAYYSRSDYETSLEYNQKALAIRLRHGDAYSLLSSYSKIGNCLHDLGRFDEALAYILKSLEIAEQNKLVMQQGLIANNIAEVFKAQENYIKAADYYSKAIEIASQLNDTLGLAKASMNLGVMKMREGEFVVADSLYKTVSSLIEGKKHLEMEAGLNINYGVMYKEQGKQSESIDAYRKAKAIYEQTGEVHGLAIVYSNLGNTFLQARQNDSAKVYYQKGVELAHKTGSLTRLQFAYESLTNYFLLNKNYQNAFKYDSIADMYRDSVFTVGKSKIIEELNTRYETEKKEKLLAEKNIELANQQVTVQRRNSQLMSVSGGLFTLLVIGVFVYRDQKNKQEKLKQQVALEKAEATNKVQEEKLRISRDLHDNIGSQLTFMVSTLDNLKYIKTEDKREQKLIQLASFTKDTMAQLRETIWALNSDTISYEQLVTRIAGFLNQAKLASPDIHFRNAIQATNQTFEAKQAINIYRAVQEAVNNAIKYASATEIVFKADSDKITIADNGKGFDPETITLGNGLANIKSRLLDAGFSAEIISKPGNGTKVILYLG